MRISLPGIILLFFYTAAVSQAQYYDTGEDPASIRWYQVKTDNFTLVYPESYSNEIQRFAGSLENAFSLLSPLYKIKKTSFPVVIHNYTTFSNGYVVWAPKRMEIFPTPEQNTIPLDHIDQLTLHELTHIMQMYSLDKGFTRLLSLFLGEQAPSVTSSLVPLWVFEGNAVLSESVFTSSGRGRTPGFQKHLKAIILERDKLFSYDKMLLGSYRNYLPDYYQYGFQMAAWGYSKYGQKIWNNAFDFAAKYPFTVYPVSLSNMRTAGLKNSLLYSQTFDSLRSIWGEELLKRNPVKYKPLNPPKGKGYIAYHSPVITGKDSIVAIKTSLSAPASFVMISRSTGKEKRIHIPGDIYPWVLSGCPWKLAWVEQQPDPRWANRDYSVIKIMNLKTGIVQQLSRKTRYMAVSISPDGRFLAASENSVENKNRLIIIDAFNGQILNSIPSPENYFLQRPQWSASGDEITAITLGKPGEGIVSYSLKKQQWATLLEPGSDDIQASFLRNDSLLFVSSRSGTDNLYLLAPDNNLYSLTNSRYGAYDIFPGNDSVFFSDYTLHGNDIAVISVRDAVPAATGDTDKDISPFLISRFDTLRRDPGEDPKVEISPKPYRKWQHPFRFHSWMPFYADVDELMADPTNINSGLTLLSQNTLGTLISSFGYEYSDGNSFLHTRVTWKGWFPVIESSLDYGHSPVIYKLGNQVGDPATIIPGIRFTNSISLPLYFSSGRFSQLLWSSLSAGYQNNYIYQKETNTYDYGQTRITARFYFLNQHRSSHRDIYPRWAQVVDYSTSFFPADREFYGNLSSLKTALYLPGPVKNHGIRLRFEADRQDPEKLLLYNRASFPRSYTDIISLDLNFFSADYVMPLVYPDFNIPGLLFIKRIRSGFFYDYASATDNTYIVLNQRHNYRENFRSFGAELLADFNLLRIPFTISAGVQSAWKNLKESPTVEAILRIDVYGTKIGRRSSDKTW